MRLRPGMTVRDLTDEMFKTGVLGAGRVGKAVDIVAEIFSDDEYTTFITLSGPLVPSGMRQIFTDLIREGFVDAYVTNGANIVHDVIEAIGEHHMVGKADVDDEWLLKKGINRAYEIFIDSNSFIEVEKFICDILDSIPEKKRVDVPFNSLIREIGLKIKDENSILYNASVKGVPIFCPGFLDSMLGIPLWMYSKRNKLMFNPLKDFDLLSEMVYDAKKTGAIILGGGMPKHHAQYMNTLREGLDAAIQISTARVEDGSLSGAPLKESISWGKLKGDKACTIFGDVTIVFPVIVAAALEKIHR